MNIEEYNKKTEEIGNLVAEEIRHRKTAARERQAAERNTHVIHLPRYGDLMDWPIVIQLPAITAASVNTTQ
jgi:hypothetical protein